MTDLGLQTTPAELSPFLVFPTRYIQFQTDPGDSLSVEEAIRIAPSGLLVYAFAPHRTEPLTQNRKEKLMAKKIDWHYNRNG